MRKASKAVGELALRWDAAVVNTPAVRYGSEIHPFYTGGVGHAGSPTLSKIFCSKLTCV